MAVSGFALIRMYPKVLSPPQKSGGNPGHDFLHLSVDTWISLAGSMLEHQQLFCFTIASPYLRSLQNTWHSP